MGDCSLNFLLDAFHHFIAAILGVLGAYFCRDGETGGHGHAKQVHLSQVCAFTAEQVSVGGFSFGLSIAERIDSFHKSWLSYWLNYV